MLPMEHQVTKYIIDFRAQIQEATCDIIGDQFWLDNPEVLDPKIKL